MTASHFVPLAFPLLGKTACWDPDPDGFSRFDLSLSCPIPVPGLGHPGAFGYTRRHHIHEGVDLYGQEGDLVVALFGGTVVFNGPFTGPLAGLPWWLPTSAVAIESSLGVIFHGEIEAFHLPKGTLVEAGTPLGRLVRVLKKDKGRPVHMLHLEYYRSGARSSIGIWELGMARPSHLLDPTDIIGRSAGLEALSVPLGGSASPMHLA